MRFTVKGYLFAVALILAAAVAHAETVDRIVAVVNGDIILYSELESAVKMVQQTNPAAKTDDPAKLAQLERDVLQQMVRDRLSDQEAQRLKISVADKDIDEAVEDLKRANHLTDAQLDYVIQQNGQNRTQFRSGLKKELLRSRLIERVLKSKTIITEEQVDAALKTVSSGAPAAPAPASTGKQRLAVIYLPVSEGAGSSSEVEKLAKDVYGKVKGGADFARLAKEVSKGPAPEQGGDIGFIAPDELAPAIASAVRTLKKNEVSELVKTPTGFYILKVVDVEGSTPVMAEASVPRDKVRRALMQREVNRKYEEWVRDLEARSFIKISL